MRIICMMGILSFLFAPMFAQSPECNIIGLWLTEKEQGIVDVYEKEGKYYGKLIWLKKALDENGCPVLDSKNQNKALRGRELKGIHILESFVYDRKNKEWNNGKVYGPNMGLVANGVITFINKDTLKVVGYVGFKSISKSEIWKRIDGPTLR